MIKFRLSQEQTNQLLKLLDSLDYQYLWFGEDFGGPYVRISKEVMLRWTGEKWKYSVKF
jgi:hypothetical protein